MKKNKDLNLSRNIETLETIASSNAKIRDLQVKENKNKKFTETYLCNWRFHVETHNGSWNF